MSINKNNFLSMYMISAVDYEVRNETFEGRPHIVVPVVMMVEGVHNGSNGPIFHPGEELGKIPESWNGIPVSILHPEEDGAYVSANDPEVIQAQSVGRVFNTQYVDNKLKAEIWIDLEKADRLSPETLQYIRNREPLDVSVGVFTEDQQITGIFGGERYIAVARNLRPDHLALLPGGTGACSWSDGCGIRAYGKGGDKLNVFNLKKNDVEFEVIGYVDKGFQEISRDIQTMLDTLDNDMRIHYLVEVYDNYFIYQVDRRERVVPSSTLYKRSYSVTDNEVVFSDDAVEVRKEVNYVNVNEEGEKMPKPKENSKKACCPEKVELLLQHESYSFTDEDRGVLGSLDESLIDKMLDVKPIEVPVKVNSGNKVVTENDAIKALHDKLSDPEKVMSLLPPKVASYLRLGLKTYENERKTKVDFIIANCNGAYTEDDLKKSSPEAIENLFKALGGDRQDPDFSGMGFGGDFEVNSNQPDEILYNPIVEKEDK